MPKKAKYDKETPFSVFVASYPPNSTVCAEAQKWNNKYLNKTLGEIADSLATNPDYESGWGIWLLHKFGEELDVEIRKKLLASIKDSMKAFGVYLAFSWLTDEEDKMLEEKFKGKLPTAEKELADNIVTRAKNG